MKNRFLLFFLLSLTLCACQRETYHPTATSGAPEVAGNTSLTTPSATPGLVGGF